MRHVVVVSDRIRDDDGGVIGTHGFYIDVSPAHHQAQQDEMSVKLAEISENRAAIEQTKGMLMLIYGISASAAFDLLRWLSQEANVKLRPLAEQIAADFRRARLALNQSEFDHLMLTAHERVERDGDGA